MDFNNTEIGIGILLAILVAERLVGFILKIIDKLKTTTSNGKFDLFSKFTMMQDDMAKEKVVLAEKITSIEKDIQYLTKASDETASIVKTLNEKVDWVIGHLSLNECKIKDK